MYHSISIDLICVANIYFDFDLEIDWFDIKIKILLIKFHINDNIQMNTYSIPDPSLSP